MAAPVIKIKRSSVPGKIPTTASLPLGELALNTNDGKVYIQQDSVGIGSTVIVVNPWSVGLGSDTYNTFFTAGSVGIGTTIPTSSLHVVGIVSATSFIGDGSGLTGIVGSGGGSSQFVTTSVGIHTLSNVGIGTTNPTSALTVSGDGSFTGVVTATSFFGDGSALTNLPGGGGGVNILFNDINIGTGITSLNFSGTGISSVTSNISGISTVTVDLQSNLDGGTPTTNYGGIDSINGGGV